MVLLDYCTRPVPLAPPSRLPSEQKAGGGPCGPAADWQRPPTSTVWRYSKHKQQRNLGRRLSAPSCVGGGGEREGGVRGGGGGGGSGSSGGGDGT